MARLSQHDFRAISALVEELYAAPTLDAYAATIVHGLSRIIRSDICTFNEANPQRRRIRWVANTEDRIPDGPDIFARHMHEHPFIRYWNSAITTHHAVKLSDFVSQRQWRDRGIYTEFYGPSDVEHMLGATLRADQPRELHVVAFRKTQDFVERDRLALSLLGPHLSAAYANAETIGEFQAQLSALRKGLEASGHSLISLRHDGRIRDMNETAWNWLVAYFGSHWSDPARLPEPLADWVQREAVSDKNGLAGTNRVMAVERGSKRLCVQLLSDGHRLSLLLSERKLGIAAEDLASLGLARRETEVLAWLAGGKTNREIADFLGLSPATIKHCVERIFAKLNVGTRAAATAIAVATAGADGR